MEGKKRDLVAEILSGELAENSPEARAALEAQPELRIELEELRELEGLLETEATFEREARMPVTPRPHTRLWLVFGAVAALLIALLTVPPLLKQSRLPSLPGEGQMLGTRGPAFELSAPHGPHSAYESFRILGMMPAGATVIIEIWDNEAPETKERIYSTSTTLKQASPQGFTWSPPSDLSASWPASIRWAARIEYLSGNPPTLIHEVTASR